MSKVCNGAILLRLEDAHRHESYEAEKRILVMGDFHRRQERSIGRQLEPFHWLTQATPKKAQNLQIAPTMARKSRIPITRFMLMIL